MSKPRNLPLGSIRTDGETQPRVKTNYEAVDEYAEVMRAKPKRHNFPPLDVFWDGASYWLVSGFQRYLAAQQAGLREFACEVHEGTLEDARWFASATNQDHGVRRSNEDKRKAAEMALLLRPKESNRAIAEHCGVSESMVRDVRKELEASARIAQMRERYVTRNGATFTQKVPEKTHDETPAEPEQSDTLATIQDRIAEAIQADPEASDVAIAKELNIPADLVAGFRLQAFGEQTEDEGSETGTPDEAESEEESTTEPGPTPARRVVRDRVGIPIPDEMLPDWVACHGETQVLRAHLRAAARSLDALCNLPGGELLGKIVGLKVRGQKASYRSRQLDSLGEELRFNLPFACVCPYCHHAEQAGEGGDNSRCCRGVGWVSEKVWAGAPEEYRELVCRDFGAEKPGQEAEDES